MKAIKRRNFNFVMENIKNAFWAAEKEQQDIWLESFNGMLDDLLTNDFFGTEGQCDPRGDHRD